MIKFFRKIRHKMLFNNRFSKYLLYAAGEIVLVVIGILIALQINNTNQKKLDQASLEGYLNSMSQNIASDLKKAKKINEKRLELFPRISAVERRMTDDYYQIRSEVYNENFPADYRYSIENLDFMSRTINDAWGSPYLTPNLSGFESLKSSGFLSQLQGTDLEQLIFSYYNLLDELITYENKYNASLQNSFDDFINADLPGTNAFFRAGTQDWHRVFEGKLPAMIEELINHPTLFAVINWPYELILKYDNLILLGETLDHMLTTGSKDFDDKIKEDLELVFDEYGEAPYSKILRDGYVASSYNYAVSSAQSNQGVNIQFLETHATLQFHGEAWAVAYWFVGAGVVDPNRVKDYSKFKKIRLQLRGVKGGEEIAIALKDKSNPTDGSETKVPLTLTKDWQSYEIPLSSFAPTRMEELFIVTSIIVLNQACAIEVKSIEFLK